MQGKSASTLKMIYIQVLMSGRSNEIADVNQTVVSLENKLKISEALNASLSGKIASIKGYLENTDNMDTDNVDTDT